MADLQFRWASNLGDVAREIDRDLARIGKSIQQSSSRTGEFAGVTGDVGRGVRGRIDTILADSRRAIATAGTELGRELEKIKAGRGSLEGSVQRNLLGGTADDPKNVFNQVNDRFKRLSRELDLAIQGNPALEGQREQLQQQLRAAQQQVIANLRAFYTEVATDLKTARDQAGIAGKQFPVTTKVRADVEGRGRGAVSLDGPEGTRAQRDVALRRILDSADISDADIERAIQADRQLEAALADSARETERLAQELRANTDLDGKLRNSLRARRENIGGRSVIFDNQGRPFVEDEVDLGEGRRKKIVRPFDSSEVEDPLDRQKVDAQLAEAKRRARQGYVKDVQASERAAQEGQELAAARARAQRALELDAQIRLDRSRPGGAARVGNFARDRDGRLFEFTDGGEGVQELRQAQVKKRGAAEDALFARDQRLIRAKDKELAAQQRISSQASQRAATTGGRGGGGGIIDRIINGSSDGGFGGRGLNFDDILTSALSFSRYLISAAAFGAVFTVLDQVRDALLDYEDSLTDLEVALGEVGSAQKDFTDSLASISRFTGENPGAAFDSAARGIRAFTDATASIDEKNEFGEGFADAAQTLAVITGKTLEDASGDIIAIANVFEASFERINDAIASAKQTSGADPGEIAQGVAAIGTAAREAGFDLEETSSLVSTVIARTDQTGRAAATRLSRALSIVGGSAGQSAIAQINSQIRDPNFIVDQGGSVRDQLEQLAAVYPQLNASQQAFIRNSAGGAANQREFLTVLTEFDTILNATEESYGKAGEAAAEFNRKASDLAGEVKQIQGSLKNIIVQLADAGLFDIFGAAIETIEPLLSAVEALLQFYNRLPGPLKTLVALTLQYAAAQALLNKVKAARAAQIPAEVAAEATLTSVQAVAVARQRRAATASNLLAGSVVFPAGTFGRPFPPRPRASAASGLSFGANRGGLLARAGARFPLTAELSRGVLGAAVDGIGSAFSRLGAFLSSPAGLATVGIAGLLSALRFAEQGSRLNDALNDSNQFGGLDFDTDLRGQISAREQAALDVRQESSGFFGSITDFFRGFEGRNQAELLEDSVEGLNAASEAFEERIRNSLRSGSDADLIDLGSTDGISDGLKTLEENGRSATSRLQALKDAVVNLGEAANAAESSLSGRDRVEFESFIGSAVADEIDLTRQLQGDIGGRLFVRLFDPDQFQAGLFASNLADADIDQERINEIASNFLEGTGGQLTAEDQESLTDLIFPVVQEGLPQFDDLTPDQQNQLRQQVRAAVRGTKNSVQDVVDEYIQISQFISSSLDTISAASKEVGQNASLSGDPRGGDLAGAQFALAELEEARRTAVSKGAGPEQLQELDIAIGARELEVQQALRARVQSTAELAKSQLNESLDVERLQIDIQRVQDELSIATDEVEIEGLQAELNTLYRQVQQAVLARIQASRAAVIDPRDTGGQARDAVTTAREAVRFLEDQGDTSSAQYYNELANLRKAQQDLADFELQLASSRRLANVDPRDTLGQARAELSNSIGALENSLQGTPEYYDNLTAVRQAQLSLAEQEVELASAQRALGVDSRSSVEQARAEIEDVRDRLGLTLQGSIEYFQTLKELQDAQVGFSEAVLAAESLARQVDIDLTDPVATTAEALLTAQRNLAAAISQGAPEDVLNQLRIEEQSAQAQAEAAAFQQRFNDARTARDLGRISHAEYLSYLQEEQARLQAIQDRTRQQQEQLNQVESAIKAANDALSGQFNLGDINVPTPFEARRSVAEQLGATFTASGSVVNNETTIIIDGTDLAAVQRIIEESVGRRAVRRFSGTGPRT